MTNPTPKNTARSRHSSLPNNQTKNKPASQNHESPECAKIFKIKDKNALFSDTNNAPEILASVFRTRLSHCLTGCALNLV